MQHYFHLELFSPGNNKVISVAHPADSFDDFGLIVFNHFDPFELLADGV